MHVVVDPVLGNVLRPHQREVKPYEHCHTYNNEYNNGYFNSLKKIICHIMNWCLLKANERNMFIQLNIPVRLFAL